MFDELIYGHRLRRLQRSRRELVCTLSRLVRSARKEKKSPEELERIEWEWHQEIRMVDDEILMLQSTFLRQTAQSLLVPIPPLTMKDKEYEFWEESRSTGAIYLKETTAAALRSAIRTERKDRRDRWLPIVTALTGLGGVTVGVLSLLLKK